MASFSPDSAVVTAVCPSPNHGARKDGRAPDAIILHYTGMESEDAALKRLCDPSAEVSCHYLIRENGGILQLVPESRRAWHAGASSWAGERDMNSSSIGIEIANGGHDFGLPTYPGEQIAALIALCRDILSRRKISAHRVLAHSDIAPLRKRDPGEHFPWEALATAGIGPSVVPMPCGNDAPLAAGARGEDVAALQRKLADYGYDIGVDGIYGKKTEAVVAAFQRHFRPERVDGKADLSTRATLRRMIETRS
ncbi:MAG: N-acetylmuramoyl-L-alanine amidase [Methylovirgula sp.]|jgi:N-acetylmuramoyl-L-alanine amidase